jgi:hypothetical protein
MGLIRWRLDTMLAEKNGRYNFQQIYGKDNIIHNKKGK